MEKKRPMSINRILIVEDELLVAEDLRSDLSLNGFNVLGVVVSAKQAITMAETTKPDLVLMDIVLEGEGDGIEAAKHLGDKLRIPVVFLTAYTDAQTLERVKEVSPFGYIVKPYNLRAVIATINIALNKDRFRLKVERRLARVDPLEAAGRIAAQVAHDFNNLLMPLTAYPALIRQHLYDPGIVGMLDEMESAIKQMAEINLQLLSLGRRATIKFEVFNPTHMIRKVVSAIDFPDRIAVQMNLADDSYPIVGAPAQLSRVISNLIYNAIQAMPDGGLLHICAENAVIKNSDREISLPLVEKSLKLTITDTGCGIQPHLIDKIFEPFFTTKKMDEKKGSGLGLSIVRNIVQDHHGHINVQSQVKVGTTFTLCFPAVDSGAVAGSTVSR